MITYEERHQAIEEFARTKNSSHLGLAYYNPDSNSLVTHCIQNVLNRVDEQGGAIKYGWTFHHRVNFEFGDYLFVTHHAVWHNHTGNLEDITPFHDEEKHRPLTEQGDVLFLLDENAQPLHVGHAIIPLPLIYFPVKRNPRILEYLKLLTKQEEEYYQNNFGIDITKL